jgi:hypothetical protein
MIPQKGVSSLRAAAYRFGGAIVVGSRVGAEVLVLLLVVVWVSENRAKPLNVVPVL